MRKILLTGFLVLAMVYLSGCATILGGIIGYQSGEACAGMAIGAALDFGGYAIDGIGKLIGGKPKSAEVSESEKIKVYSDMGYIRVNSKFSQCSDLIALLRREFEGASWQIKDTPAASGDKEISSRMYQCQTAEGKEFTMEVISEKRQDARVYIKCKEDSAELKRLITSQVGIWLAQSIKR